MVASTDRLAWALITQRDETTRDQHDRASPLEDSLAR
jgi:hypothetical protein